MQSQLNFALSLQCETLNYFCSHSWATGRWFKYLALLVHFNLGRALLAVLICNCASVYAACWCPRLVPSWLWMAYSVQPDMAVGQASLAAEFIIGPVFSLVLCFGHRFSRCRTLFLDIACIRQDSDAAKADGIAALGAVLDRSQRMLVLCDAQYFSRLWCTFELAAYTKRAGASRIDLLPLHEALVTLSLLLDLIFFFSVAIIIFCLLPALGVDLSAMSMDASQLPLFVLLLHAPGQLFVVVAQVEACRMRRAVARLTRFKLEDARCHSDSDRDELQKLIAKWFSERNAHEAGEDARRVGFHRFETYVRHAVAPSLMSSNAYYAKILLACWCFSTAPFFDMLTSEVMTPSRISGILCMMALIVCLTIPFYLLVYRWVAQIVIALRERCHWPAALAYAVGVLLNNVALLGFLAACYLPCPQSYSDPDYRLPLELDPTARKMMATHVVTILTGLGALAVAGVFQF